ncbi:hypothetical protein ASF71_20390 [Deinococcus sp. Leaf326]|nr:hypothetical protein ASF71_20390 [Deinococcus sp. Leaf326]
MVVSEDMQLYGRCALFRCMLLEQPEHLTGISTPSMLSSNLNLIDESNLLAASRHELVPQHADVLVPVCVMEIEAEIVWRHRAIW